MARARMSAEERASLQCVFRFERAKGNGETEREREKARERGEREIHAGLCVLASNEKRTDNRMEDRPILRLRSLGWRLRYNPKIFENRIRPG